MKKTILAVIMITAMLAVLTGCGGTEAFSLEKDMGISIDGTWYPIYSDAAPLLDAIGSDYELFAAPSCLFDGEDKEFSYSSCSVFTNPDGEKDIWYIMQLNDDTYSTARGIKVGDTKEELTEAYGEKYYMESDYQMVYSVSGVQGDIASPCIIFDLDGDVITRIEIYYPTNV